MRPIVNSMQLQRKSSTQLSISLVQFCPNHLDPEEPNPNGIHHCPTEPTYHLTEPAPKKPGYFHDSTLNSNLVGIIGGQQEASWTRLDIVNPCVLVSITELEAPKFSRSADIICLQPSFLCKSQSYCAVVFH